MTNPLILLYRQYNRFKLTRQGSRIEVERVISWRLAQVGRYIVYAMLREWIESQYAQHVRECLHD